MLSDLELFKLTRRRNVAAIGRARRTARSGDDNGRGNHGDDERFVHFLFALLNLTPATGSVAELYQIQTNYSCVDSYLQVDRSLKGKMQA